MRQVLLELLTWRDIEEIIHAEEEVLRTSPGKTYPTPEDYFNEVLKMVRGDSEFRPPISERYGIVLWAAQLAVGKQLCSGRAEEDVLIRVFTAYRLRKEGYSLGAIGRVMHRDHSTITHYIRNKMSDMLAVPRFYRRELEMYDKMNEILDNARRQ